jgi:hypothetical protein
MPWFAPVTICFLALFYWNGTVMGRTGNNLSSKRNLPVMVRAGEGADDGRRF